MWNLIIGGIRRSWVFEFCSVIRWLISCLMSFINRLLISIKGVGDLGRLTCNRQCTGICIWWSHTCLKFKAGIHHFIVYRVRQVIHFNNQTISKMSRHCRWSAGRSVVIEYLYCLYFYFFYHPSGEFCWWVCFLFGVFTFTLYSDQLKVHFQVISSIPVVTIWWTVNSCCYHGDHHEVECMNANIIVTLPALIHCTFLPAAVKETIRGELGCGVIRWHCQLFLSLELLP